MTGPLSIAASLTNVMEDVGAVAKAERNTSQNFNFRGIDAVVNAVSPMLRKHGVIVYPNVLSYTRDQVTTTKGSAMNYITVHVSYTFMGPAGDSITCSTLGAAFDSGDKGEPKAMSVAFRVALLQALCLPTDEPDVDSESHEMARRVEPLPDSEGAEDWFVALTAAIESGDATRVLAVRKDMAQAKVLDHIYKGQTLSKLADLAMQKVAK